MSNYYFKHDQGARNDPKIRAMINKYGLEGYGRFWVVVEMMRENSKYKLEDKDFVWEAIAENFKSDISQARAFVNDCINKYELFIMDDGFFYSPALLSRMVKLDEIRRKRVYAADIRHGNRERWDE